MYPKNLLSSIDLEIFTNSDSLKAHGLKTKTNGRHRAKDSKSALQLTCACLPFVCTAGSKIDTYAR